MPRKVEVVAGDPAWPELFCAGAERLRRVFGAELLVIHHMGSTAVPGLSAKPIISDIAGKDAFIKDLEQQALAWAAAHFF